MDMKKKIENAIIGLAVGDAVGVPVEFKSRSELKSNPVKEMREYGTHYQPKGTWSDDTSMTLAFMDAVIKDSGEINERTIMDNFVEWYDNGKFTTEDYCFDIGNCVSMAISRYIEGVEPTGCGPSGEYDCGNGALMRIIPLGLYIRDYYYRDLCKLPFTLEYIERITKLTHGNQRCIVANVIYLAIADELLMGREKIEAIIEGLEKAKLICKDEPEMLKEFNAFKLLYDPDLIDAPEVLIRSSGYVVDTLTASVWCLLTTDSYRECILKAVNLGDDTDTTGAVVGALAGIYYGEEGIPEEWIKETKKLEYIREICNNFYKCIDRGVRRSC